MRHFIDIVEAELPMDLASRMARAEQLGFTIPAFHGTKAAFNEFDLEKGKPSVMGGYAPHFSDKRAEARGYATRTKGARVLEVLLRVRKPLVISYTDMEVGRLSPEDYKSTTGKDWDSDRWHPTGKAALQAVQDAFGWHDHRANWTHTYKALRAAGYDALFYPNVPADHSSGHYGKYVVFDPKNVRSVEATFDPSKSESADLLA